MQFVEQNVLERSVRNSTLEHSTSRDEDWQLKFWWDRLVHEYVHNTYSCKIVIWLRSLATHAAVNCIKKTEFFELAFTEIFYASRDLFQNICRTTSQNSNELFCSDFKTRTFEDVLESSSNREFCSKLDSLITLIMNENVIMIGKYYHHMNELISLRKSTVSILSFDKTDAVVSLWSIMSLHQVKTVKFIYTNNETVECQWTHRLHAQ